jgi:hypothetical protein
MPRVPVQSDPGSSSSAARQQCADAVLMVRPAAFGWNAETADSNRYQSAADAHPEQAAIAARAEFDGVASALARAGVRVHVFDDRPQPQCPDAVFPNNWVTLHSDGTVVLYPMLAPNRRLERRLDLLLALERAGPYRVRRLVDLTHHEQQGRYLEGTGSVVLDHVARVAYACVSPRTHLEPLHEFCDELGYEPCTFNAVDRQGVPVYHTNVVLSVGQHVAVVAAGSVADADRDRLLEKLAAGGRLLESIDDAQVARFAGNALELRAATGASVLALSAQALSAFGPEARARLSARVDRLVAVPVPTIERLGGGSVRCMLAEVFLPADTAG